MNSLLLSTIFRSIPVPHIGFLRDDESVPPSGDFTALFRKEGLWYLIGRIRNQDFFLDCDVIDTVGPVSSLYCIFLLFAIYFDGSSAAERLYTQFCDSWTVSHRLMNENLLIETVQNLFNG